jgi:hypothetical protein
VKVFEVEVVHVHEVLVQVARTSSEVCSSDSSNLNNSSSQNAVPTVSTVNKKKKAGRPKTTHRKEDEELFKRLRHNPDGNGVERKEWQIAKWDQFKSG